MQSKPTVWLGCVCVTANCSEGLQKFHNRFYWLRLCSQFTIETGGNSRLTLPFLCVVVVSNFDQKHGQDTNSL